MDGDTCKHGHELTPENTYIRPGTSTKRCRTCQLDNQRRFRERRRGDPNELPSPVMVPGQRSKPRLSEVVDLDPAAFAVPIPAVAKVRSGKPTVTVWLSDTHIPHHDPRALEVVHGVIKDVRPDRLIHGGDWLDCYSISRFDRDPTHLFGLQNEIDEARRQMAQLAALAPETERWWLIGNHEDRLRKVVWSLPGTAAELARLRSFGHAMTWQSLTNCDEVGWTVVPVEAQTKTEILPGIITKHGTVVRKWSSYTAKGEWEKYGRSGISGHTHRLGQFYTRDFNGNHVWTEGGCTCLVDPEYVQDPNWQQGCVVIEHSGDGERFAVHTVYIQDGRALWRGMDYRAAA